MAKHFRNSVIEDGVVRRATNFRSKSQGRFFHRECGDDFGAAKQEFAHEADINFIMSKYRISGVLNSAYMGPPGPTAIDMGFKTHADVYSALKVAEEHFLKLPPEVRLELGNDPARYAEVSTEEGFRNVLSRMGAKTQRRIAEAQALVASLAPKEPAAKPPVDGGSGGVAPGSTK